MQAKDKIDILFKEYDTLRAEILTRTSSGYQIMGIGAAILTWLLTILLQDGKSTKGWILLLTFAVVFLLLTWQSFGEIGKAAARLRVLESKINQLAGEELLEWENGWGAGKRQFLFRVFRATYESGPTSHLRKHANDGDECSSGDSKQDHC